jgi:hypothetical protein
MFPDSRMRRRRPVHRIALPLLAASALLADAVRYSAIIDLHAQTDLVVAEHLKTHAGR